MSSPAAVTVFFPAIRIPQPDGSVIIRPGAGKIMDELTVSQFARHAGISRRRILQLCDEGRLQFRRLTSSPCSKLMIPATELNRILNRKNE